MQSVYLQRIMKKNAAKGYEKTKDKEKEKMLLDTSSQSIMLM